MTEPSQTPPLLRVVRGDPTAEELAALVAVLAAVAVPAPAPAPPRSRWAAPARGVASFDRPAWGSWRTSAQPG